MSDTPNTETGRDTRTDYNSLNTDAMRWLSALVALLGLYLVASPFLFEATDAAIWNDTLVGTAIFLAAGYNFVRLSRDRLASVGVASLAVLLGLLGAHLALVYRDGKQYARDRDRDHRPTRRRPLGLQRLRQQQGRHAGTNASPRLNSNRFSLGQRSRAAIADNSRFSRQPDAIGRATRDHFGSITRRAVARAGPAANCEA